VELSIWIIKIESLCTAFRASGYNIPRAHWTSTECWEMLCSWSLPLIRRSLNNEGDQIDHQYNCSSFNQVHFFKEQLVSPILFSLTSIIHYDIAENEVKIIASTSCITAFIFSIGIFTLVFLLQRSKNDLRNIIKSKCQLAANIVVHQKKYQNAMKFKVVGFCDSCILLSSNCKL
jgi:hypothetical protein